MIFFFFCSFKQCKKAQATSKTRHHQYPLLKRRLPCELFGDLLKTEQQTKTFPQKIEEEVSSYKAAGGLNVDADPFRWWKEHQVTFPYISKVAQRYLCVPGTSVASERVFSTAGDIVSASRSRLDPDHVDTLIFLQKNLNIKT